MEGKESNALFDSITPEQIRSVLGSKEGQQLLQLLNRDGGAALKQAAARAKAGDLEGAKRAVAPIMETGEAAQLVERINRRQK